MRARLLPFLVAFTLAFIALAAVSAQVLNHGYMTEQALRLWSHMLLTSSNPEYFEVKFLAEYPPLIHFIGWMLSIVPGVGHFPLPFLIDNLVGAGLVALWYVDLQRAGYHAGQAAIFTLLLALHPFLVWGATSGEGFMLAVLAFYIVARTAFLLKDNPDVQHLMMLGFAVAFLFISDPRGLYIGLAIVPFLIFLGSPPMIKSSPTGFFLLALFPTLFAFGAIIYVNWLFLNDGFAFFNDLHSPLHGAHLNVQDSLWLMVFGGRFIDPLIVCTMITLACFPILVFALYRYRKRLLLFWPLFVSTATVVLAAAFTTSTNFASHPASILVMLAPLAALSIMFWPRRLEAPMFWYAVTLTIGIVAGAAALVYFPSDSLTAWARAIPPRPATALAAPVEAAYALAADHRAELNLGRFLADSRDVMIDERSAYAAIDGRGTGSGLVVSTADAFQHSLITRKVRTRAVAIPDPAAPGGKRDLVNQSLPMAYENGFYGYRLIYDRMGWRVYEKCNGSQSDPEDYGQVRENAASLGVCH